MDIIMQPPPTPPFSCPPSPNPTIEKLVNLQIPISENFLGMENFFLMGKTWFGKHVKGCKLFEFLQFAKCEQ